MHLVEKLGLGNTIPLVDPCLFISRFCEKLKFGDKKNAVVKLATRFL